MRGNNEFRPFSDRRLREVLDGIRNVRVAVLGDYCLDIYWFTDLSQSEASVETGRMTRPVREQRYTLGGAGNVVNNLAALGCRRIHALGVVGNDPWGREMRRLLMAVDVRTEGLLTQDENWSTLAYNKPYIEQEESNRFDFGNFNKLSDTTADVLLDHARALLPEVDIVIVNQQVRQGIHNGRFRAGLAALVQDDGHPVFIVDSRHFSESFTGAHLKINDIEAVRVCGGTATPGDLVLREDAIRAAGELHRRVGRPVFITRGRRGMITADKQGIVETPGLQMMGAVDTVGAGDSALAGISLALAGGFRTDEAAQFGNLVAGVTIQKINQTGTASPDEILALGHEQAYIYRPELADDPRRAWIPDGTEIEVVRPVPEALTVRHAIFDHDGTLSVLRQGWEAVMEPMMIKTILGSSYESADETLYQRVVARVRRFIDESTGIQTLVQMQGLVNMVREFECVREADILDEFGYKAIYNEALLSMVRERLTKLRRGELAVDDFVIKNAVALLQRLHAAGVRMYLASGTDQADVEAEAEALGYAALFEGGIHGAVGDVRKEAKRMVIERILSEVGDQADQTLITFGDGPVEIRETRRRGGYAVGLATDEVRRYGLNPSKRTRLIRAGADLVVPDFSQLDSLLHMLRLYSWPSGHAPEVPE